MSRFYPIGNSTGWGKYGACPVFTPRASHFYPKLRGKMGTPVKAVFLLSKSHWIVIQYCPFFTPEDYTYFIKTTLFYFFPYFSTQHFNDTNIIYLATC